MEEGNKAILIDADHPDTHFLTKEQFRLLSKQVALGLIKASLQPGNRVLVFSSNNVYFPSVFLGILMSGAIFTGANPSFSPRELAYQLKNSEATHMFVAANQLPTALEAAATVGLPKENIFVLDPSILPPVGTTPIAPSTTKDGLRMWTDLIADTQEQAKTWKWVEPQDPETTAVVLISNLEPDPEVQKRSKGLGFLPMYHAYAQTYYISVYPHLNIPAYIMPSFDFEKMLQHIQRFRISK
ncbi:hypothetical protein F53441_14432 [Fusarium austroafricanum]|uniref:AMP-dependent synthetase/ligase domain-containing protein n=1 Tax=Fusarium austroafricanum TaxID=2364996 RepID=A0A8H4JFP6_9HYPO|nr:hypothetical protein F53441_14432 [Fusarium austroafricanum]